MAFLRDARAADARAQGRADDSCETCGSSSRSASCFAGLIEVLIPQATLVRWLGGERTGRGILVGWVAGLVLPGGPYVFFPVAANLFRNGAEGRPDHLRCSPRRRW